MSIASKENVCLHHCCRTEVLLNSIAEDYSNDNSDEAEEEL